MILRLPKSEENIDETYEDNNSKDESDLINENVTKILNDSVEKAIELDGNLIVAKNILKKEYNK